MSNKRDFLNEVSAHADELRTSQKQVSASVGKLDGEIRELKANRSSRLRAAVEAALPDLSPASIERATALFPQLVTAQRIDAMKAKASETFERQLAELATRFDPSKAEERKLALKVRLQGIAEDLVSVSASFNELDSMPNVRELVENCYDTKGYSYSIFTRRYWSDWKAADEAVDAAKFKDWAALAAQYKSRRADVMSVNGTQAEVEQALAAIQADERSLRELKEALGEVPHKVLEQLHTKLRGLLDTDDTAAAKVDGVAKIDARIVELQEQVSQLQEVQTKITGQLADLQRVSTAAAKSRSTEVPVEYVEQIRGQRAAYASAVASPSPTSSGVVYIHHYDYGPTFSDGLLYGEMSAHFDQQVRAEIVEEGSRGSYSRSYDDARDRFGGFGGSSEGSRHHQQSSGQSFAFGDSTGRS